VSHRELIAVAGAAGCDLMFLGSFAEPPTAGAADVTKALGSFLVTATSSSLGRPMLNAVLSLAAGGVAIAVSDAPRNTHLGSWCTVGKRIEMRLLAYQFNANGDNTGYLQVDMAGQLQNDLIDTEYIVTFVPVSGNSAIVDQGTLSGKRLST
jgi:hypothetical protein